MDDLTRLLHDAVDDVEPADRLGAIRARTRRPPRTRWLAAGGAVLATAAVVTGIALAVRPGVDAGPGPSDHPTGTPTAVDSATPGLAAEPAYFLGETPQGQRLFREFQQTAPLGDDLLKLVEDGPVDPDYSTPWTARSFGEIVVRSDLGQVDVALSDASLHDRPAGMTTETAELAVQQVVYTVQAVLQQQLSVQFTLDGNPADQVLGVPAGEPLARAPQLDVLAQVNISDPSDLSMVEGSFEATGVACSFEGTVPWELRDAGGTAVVTGVAHGEFDPEKLTPWETGPIDVSGLAAGSYTFVAMTDDPSGGEGPGPTTDTRTVIVR